MFPVKPNDWITNGVQIGRVKNVYFADDTVLVDFYVFDIYGQKIGRASPACGGPRTFEPAVPYDDFYRINPPSFPMSLSRIPKGEGVFTFGYDFGERLPDLNWSPKERTSKVSKAVDPDFVTALRDIAAGHNDAKSLAREVLSRHGF